MIRPFALLAGAIIVTLAGSVFAATPDPPSARTAVRSGNHPGFGRIVIDTDRKAVYHLTQDGDHVKIHFDGDVMLGNPPAPPHNVITITTDGATADLTLVKGTRLHRMRLGGRIVLDVLDAPDDAPPPLKTRRTETSHAHPSPAMISAPEQDNRPPAAPSAPATAATAQSPPAAVPPGDSPHNPTPAAQVPVEAKPLPPPAASAPGAGVIIETQQTPPGRDVMPENAGPLGLLARRIRLPKDMDGSAFLVPFDGTTAAAAFHSGDSDYVVFDELRPVDMSQLRNDPVFRTATVRLLANGTLLRVPLPPNQSMALTQMPRGWRVAALTTEPKQQPIAVSATDGQLNLTAEQSGNVVSLADPDTGATLLVGTQHRSGQGLVVNRRSTEFILRPTIQGVVVEPLSDAVTLRQIPTGFTVQGGPAGLALSPRTGDTNALMDAAHLTRRFDFSTMPTAALLRQANRQIAEAAALPPMARGLKERGAAESFLALGLSAEAESLLHMAAAQDPAQAASAETGALTAVAALLAGRPEEANALADARLDGTDEIALWRAVRQAMRDDGSPGAAAIFATTAPLAFQYPKPIRDHIMPLIVETMIKGGEIAAAERLLDQSKDDPKLAYARALMQQSNGNTAKALDMLDALANGNDRFDRARAAVRAVELRLATRKLDKTQAADALEKLLYAWRGDAQELALRERIADLRGQTGAWRVALATLRQARIDFPEQGAAIQQRMKNTFADMIRDQNEQHTSPIDFVTTVDENADVALDTGDDDALQQALADRLLALDLPDRAKPILEKLMRSAKSDTAKARFGASLATLDAHEGDDAAAQSVLDASKAPSLPPALTEQRTILRAEVVARLGNPAAGAAMLVPFRTGGATEARAQILENASNWPGAEQAWSDCVALTLPDSGMLSEAQTRMMLRLATATARASDDASLADLRVKYGSRVGPGPLGDMFRLLTAEPVRTTADISRSQREISLAASLPADLKALRASTPPR
jgi:tetratricopeptide (TPR) repeat protein